MSFKVNKFFCHKLETAGYFLGWLGVVINCVTLYVTFVQMLVILYSDRLTLSDISDKEWRFIAVTSAFRIATSILALILNALLISGTKKRSPALVLPWLIWYCFLMIATFLGIFVAIIYINNFSQYSSVEDLQFMKICINAIFPLLCFGIYFWICIYNLRQKFLHAHAVQRQQDEIGYSLVADELKENIGVYHI